MNSRSSKEEKIAFVRGFKFGFAQDERLKITLPAPCDPDEHSPKHDLADTGDPCWCGSDNCSICLKCGQQNHD